MMWNGSFEGLPIFQVHRGWRLSPYTFWRRQQRRRRNDRCHACDVIGWYNVDSIRICHSTFTCLLGRLLLGGDGVNQAQLFKLYTYHQFLQEFLHFLFAHHLGLRFTKLYYSNSSKTELGKRNAIPLPNGLKVGNQMVTNKWQPCCLDFTVSLDRFIKKSP